MAQAYLEAFGFLTVVVDRAAKALELLRRDSDFDLVLSDVVMPDGMSGIELSRQLARSFPRLPVLLTTGVCRSAAGCRRRGCRRAAQALQCPQLARRHRADLGRSAYDRAGLIGPAIGVFDWIPEPVARLRALSDCDAATGQRDMAWVRMLGWAAGLALWSGALQANPLPLPPCGGPAAPAPARVGRRAGGPGRSAPRRRCALAGARVHRVAWRRLPHAGRAGRPLPAGRRDGRRARPVRRGLASCRPALLVGVDRAVAALGDRVPCARRATRRAPAGLLAGRAPRGPAIRERDRQLHVGCRDLSDGGPRGDRGPPGRDGREYDHHAPAPDRSVRSRRAAVTLCDRARGGRCLDLLFPDPHP